MPHDISRHDIERIATTLFGSDARVVAARKMESLTRHGIVRRPGSTRNHTYIVEVSGQPQPLVFRFNAGLGADRYEHEERSYRAIAAHTGVRVPRVFAVDTSRRLVPTPYMVLEYLTGEFWQYLTHPANPELPAHEKDAIARETGRFYARVHELTIPAEQEDAEALHVGYMLDRLEQAVQRGLIDVPARQLEACRVAVHREPCFRASRLSLCLADSEVFFARRDGEWRIAFFCDPEWVEYRHPYSDLAYVLSGAASLWAATEPVLPDARDTARLPFFRGYEERHPVDHARLVRLPVYYQLGLWANLLWEQGLPEKKQWIRAARGELIRELVRRIARRARTRPPLAPAGDLPRLD